MLFGIYIDDYSEFDYYFHCTFKFKILSIMCSYLTSRFKKSTCMLHTCIQMNQAHYKIAKIRIYAHMYIY